MRTNISYSIALHEIYKEEKNKIKFYDDIQSLYFSINQNNTFVNMLSSKMLSKAERKKIIKSIFEKKICSCIKNFLFVLIDDEYFKNILKILKDTLKRIDMEKGQIFVKIESAFPIEKQNLEKILNSIKNKWNKKFDYTLIINKELIGGIKIRINDREIDGSIKGKLDKLKKEIQFKDRIKKYEC